MSLYTRGEYQNNVSGTPDLDTFDYENLFKLYADDNKQAVFYNIIKTITAPDRLDPGMTDTVMINAVTPMTTLSYNVYGTIKLWWLICTINRIDNPTTMISPGTEIKVVKPRHVITVINSIKQQLVD